MTPSCLRLLHRMVRDTPSTPLVAFMDDLCTQLAAFPVLIIFETQIRMKLLLFCELQFWFRKNRARLRTQPFYSFINAG